MRPYPQLPARLPGNSDLEEFVPTFFSNVFTPAKSASKLLRAVAGAMLLAPLTLALAGPGHILEHGKQREATPAEAAAYKKQSEARTKRYIENVGQWNSKAKYASLGSTMNLWITDEGLTMDFFRITTGEKQSHRSGHVVGLQFVGASAPNYVQGKAEGTIDFIKGEGQAQTASASPEVWAKNLYPGISARHYYLDGKARYDLVVEPGADPSNVKLRFKGASGLKVKPTEITIKTTVGDAVHSDLFVYQTVNGKKRKVEAQFVDLGGNEVGFSLGAYDKTKQLVIDPLVYGSYYGGDSGLDHVTGVVTDLVGGVYMCGWTQSPDFPVLFGPYTFAVQGRDAFVSKLQGDVYNHDYAAYIGGIMSDQAEYIQIDHQGSIWIAGYTNSTNFPGNTNPNIQYLSRVTTDRPSGGATFRLNYGGTWTPDIPHNASPADVQDALETVVGAGNVTVEFAGASQNLTNGGEYRIILSNSLPFFITVDNFWLRAFYRTSTVARNENRAQLIRTGATVATQGEYRIQYRYRTTPGGTIFTTQTDPIPFNAGPLVVQNELRTMLPGVGDPGGNPLAGDAVRVFTTDPDNTGTYPEFGLLVYFRDAQEFLLTPQGIADPDPALTFNGSFLPTLSTEVRRLDFEPRGSIPNGGTFTLTYEAVDEDPVTTGGIPWNATGPILEEALNDIAALANNLVVVPVSPPAENLPNTAMDVVWVNAIAGGDGGRFFVQSNANLRPQPRYGIETQSDVFIMRIKQSSSTVLTPLPTKTFMTGTNREDSLTGFKSFPDDDPVLGQAVRMVISGTSILGAGVDEITLNSPQNSLAGYFVTLEFTENSTANPEGGFIVDSSQSQFVTGTAQNDVKGVDVDIEGNIYVGGTVYGGATTIDTSVQPGVFLTTPVDPNGTLRDGRLLRNWDGFVRKYNSNGQLIYSVLIGGNALDEGYGVAVDVQGSAYFTGISRSFNYPRTRGAFGETFNAARIVTIAKLNLDGLDLVYSTHMRTNSFVTPIGIAVDPRGVAYISGQVHSTCDFPDPAAAGPCTAHVFIGSIPTTGDALKAAYSAIPPPAPATEDGFLLALNSTGTGLVYGSFIGGQLDDFVSAPYIDRSGDVWVVGQHESHIDYFIDNPAARIVNDTRLPASHITPLAFRANPDPGGGIGGTLLFKRYGIDNPQGANLLAFRPTDPGRPVNLPAGFIDVNSRMDGFLLRQRIGLPTITGVTFNPSTVPGGLGATSTGTVTLNAPAPAGGFDVVLDLSNTVAASFSATQPVGQRLLVIPQGATTATFTVFTRAVTENTSVDVKATLEGLFRIGRLNIVPWLTSLTTSPSSIVGGNTLTGRVRLFRNAPAGGVTVQMTSNKPDLVSFGNVVVPQGFSTITFDINTNGVTETTPVTITATLLGTGKSQNITLIQADLLTLNFNPGRVTGGASSTGTVTLNGETGPIPFDVNLSIVGNPPGYSFNPPTLTFNPGEVSKSFTITTPVEVNDVNRTIVATRPAADGYAQSTVQGTLAIDGSALFAFSLNPAVVSGGESTEGTVTITRPAQPGGAVVALSVNPNDGGVTVPATVIVPQGQTTFKFQIPTKASIVDKVYTITAARGGVSIPAILNVNKLNYEFTITPAAISGGLTATGKITLTGNAPSEGVTVQLSSSQPSIASVPASVTVPADSSTVEFPINTTVVGADTTVTITTDIAGDVQEADLTVGSARLRGIFFEPDSVVGNKTTRCTIEFDGPVGPAGADLQITVSNGQVVRVPASVSIPAGKNAITFTIATRRVSTTQNVTVTAKASSGATVSGTLQVKNR